LKPDPLPPLGTSNSEVTELLCFKQPMSQGNQFNILEAGPCQSGIAGSPCAGEGDGTSAKVVCFSADKVHRRPHMITPTSNVNAAEIRQVATPAEVRPDPQAQTPPVQKSGQLSQDQVTLRSAGQREPDNNE
jgi:hypothetical protein